MDFSDIRSASKDEQIRAWAVEETARILPIGVDGGTLINISKMVEDYVKDGDVTNVITQAVEEGYSEGRLQVYQQLTEKGVPMTTREMREMFIEKGWLPNRPEPGTVQNY